MTTCQSLAGSGSGVIVTECHCHRHNGPIDNQLIGGCGWQLTADHTPSPRHYRQLDNFDIDLNRLVDKNLKAARSLSMFNRLCVQIQESQFYVYSPCVNSHSPISIVS